MKSRAVPVVVAVALAVAGVVAIVAVFSALTIAKGCYVYVGPAPEPPPPPAPSTSPILTDLSRWDAASTSARRAAAEDVARRLPDFALLRLETFSCGGQTHEVAIFRHAKTEMEFVLVPGGTFVIGSPAEEPNRDVFDDTQHSVTLTRPFLIARTETTQAAWKRVIGTDPSKIKGDDHPVESITWDESLFFCKKLGLDLPTDAQWERACRAGTSSRYYFGDDVKPLGDYAWYEPDPNSWADGSDFVPDEKHRSHPVGEKKPNAFGLFDMLGNVSERCADMFGRYPDGPVTDPFTPMSLPNGYPVLRGGCWSQSERNSRSAMRLCWIREGRSHRIGFRPAKTVPSE